MFRSRFARELAKAGEHKGRNTSPLTFWLPQPMFSWLEDAAAHIDASKQTLLETGVNLAVRRHIAEQACGQSILLDRQGLAHELPPHLAAFGIVDESEAIELTMLARPATQARLEYMGYADPRYPDDAFADGVRIMMRVAGVHARGMHTVCSGTEDSVSFPNSMLRIHQLPDYSREI